MRSKIFILLFFLTTYCTFGQNPWLQGKGETLISPSITHYFTNSQKDGSGNTSSFSNNGYYENYVYKLYVSTSLKPNIINLIANIPYVASTYADNSINNTNNQFGDFELGIKVHLKKISKYHYLMGSFITTVPLYNLDKEPIIAFGKFGTALSLNISGNFEWLGVNDNFHQLEIGLRKFYDSGPLQYRLFASQGYRFTKRLSVLADIDLMISTGNNDLLSQQNIQLITDFNFLKATLNLGYKISPKFEIYAGGFRDIYNKNISIGRGWQVFGIIKL